MLEPNKIRLLGYDNPLGLYPAPVTAIGSLGGQRVGVFHGSQDPLPIDNERPYSNITELTTGFLDSEFLEALIVRDESTPADLDNQPFFFDYRIYDLYALAEGKVVVYATAARVDFYSALLSTESFAAENPFIRLELAEVVRNPISLARELRACIRHPLEQSPDSVSSWYSDLLESLSEDERNHYGLPQSWADLFAGQESEVTGATEPGMDSSSSARPRFERRSSEHLTPRQQQILALVAQEYTTHEIAELIGRDSKVVESHLANIYQKFHVHSRLGAVLKAMNLGLLLTDPREPPRPASGG